MEFIQLLIRTNEIVHASMRRFKEEIIGGGDYPEVTVNQLIYLEAIFQLGSPTVSELAEHLKVSKASASVGIQKLIRSGLAEKTMSPEDRRIHHISLSGEGKKLVDAEVRALSEFSERVRGALTDEEAKVLIEIFKKIISNYDS